MSRTESPTPHRLSIEQYDQMGKAGILEEKDLVYLWKGRLIAKTTKGYPHVFAVGRLYKALVGMIPEGWHARQEQPVAMGDDSMPEPDISVVRGRDSDYSKSPTSRDTVLLIEVADSSPAEDRGEVLAANAADSIPAYWTVNLPDRRLEVYTEPTGPGEAPTYRGRRDFAGGESVPVVLDGREVGCLRVGDLLP